MPMDPLASVRGYACMVDMLGRMGHWKLSSLLLHSTEVDGTKPCMGVCLLLLHSTKFLNVVADVFCCCSRIPCFCFQRKPILVDISYNSSSLYTY